jgi:hypothetical protein
VLCFKVHLFHSSNEKLTELYELFIEERAQLQCHLYNQNIVDNGFSHGFQLASHELCKLQQTNRSLRTLHFEIQLSWYIRRPNYIVTNIGLNVSKLLFFTCYIRELN